MRDVPPGARQGVEVKSDPDEEQELEEEGEGLLVKEEEEERTAGGEAGVNLKTEKSEARDSTEERRKTEAGEGVDSKKEVAAKEEEERISEGVKAEPKGNSLLDANNDSKPLHLDSVKAEVNAAL